MLAWKNICAILPRSLPSRIFIIRKSSALRVVFKKEEPTRHVIGRGAEPLQLLVLEERKGCISLCRPSFRPVLRFLSAKASRDKKESPVLQELVESREQPQTQLTVGAKAPQDNGTFKKLSEPPLPWKVVSVTGGVGADKIKDHLVVIFKVVQAGKDVSYLGIILIGFAITGALLWFVVSELFFGFSANRVYAHALKKVKASAEVVEAIGEPIMGHGETTSRGRRRHVSYQEYLVEGENYMRVKFYVKGSKRKGTVHVDVKQGSRGNFDYRFIFVELSQYETIVVLDNR